MNLNEVVGLVRALRGHVSEPVRAAMAHGICKLVTGLDNQAARWWRVKGRPGFLLDCGIDTDPATTPDELTAGPTELALFINKWRAVCAFKTGGEWVSLTPEMISLIAAMTEDLEDLAAGFIDD